MIQVLAQKTGISKEIWTAVAVVLGILLITLFMNWKKKRRKEKEEQQEIVRRMQEDALNKSLENPFSKDEGIFEKNKRPIQVKYVKNASPEENVSAGMYQLTEINDLSQKTYMYRVEEEVMIGKQYGKMMVSSGITGNAEIIGWIFYYQKKSYIKSEGTQKIVLKRKGKEAIVNRNGIKLKTGDVFMIDKTAYQIRFMNRGKI